MPHLFGKHHVPGEPTISVEIQHNWKFLLVCVLLILLIAGSYIFTYTIMERELDAIQHFSRLTVSDGVYVGAEGTMLRQVQSGAVSIPMNTETDSATVRVSFPSAFASSPTVFLSPSMESASPFTDLTCVASRVSKSDFYVTVTRVGTGDPKLTAPIHVGWIAVL